jgi:hypothetical protein
MKIFARREYAAGTMRTTAREAHIAQGIIYIRKESPCDE